MRRVRLVQAVALALAAAPAAAGASLERHERAGIHMGVEVRIVLYAADAGTAGAALDAAFARVAALDAAFSDYRADSELSRLQAAAGAGPRVVGPDLFAVLRQARDLSLRSGGAFDATAGPLVQLWRRARRQGERPDPDRLRTALALTGAELIRLDPEARSAELLRQGMRLDLGGIAKGWAGDAALAELRRKGVGRALVALAGDVVAGDAPPGARGWRVEVAPPPGRDETETLLLANAAVSTSGDAEQFVVIDGVRYSHIVDPRTGVGLHPSRQVTVVAPNGATADGVATAACVLGPEGGIALVEATPGAAAELWLDPGTGPERVVSERWSDLPRPGARRAAR